MADTSNKTLQGLNILKIKTIIILDFTQQLPRLLPVPAFHNMLTIKATATGIVLLQDGRFKKRYTGSRYAAVDINGKLYERSSDLKREIEREKSLAEGPKRKGRGTSPRDPINILNSEDIKNNLSTEKKRSCEYRVNKQEVRQRILGMINTMKGGKELYFWTVTFPAGMPDQLCYQSFNTWLTTLRQKKYLRNYIWVAERQKNKTIHFHLAIPHKMSVTNANRFMRVTLATFCKRGLIPGYSIFQAKRYNGVDISKNRKTGRVTNFAIKKGSRALTNYLTKYVTKNDESFTHLAWHNSRGFSSLFTGITFTVAEFVNAGFRELLIPRSVISNKFFAFYPWAKDPPEQITRHLYELNSYLQGREN